MPGTLMPSVVEPCETTCRPLCKCFLILIEIFCLKTVGAYYDDRSWDEMHRSTCSCTEPVGRHPTGKLSRACVQQRLSVAARSVLDQHDEVGNSLCRWSLIVPLLPALQAHLSESPTLRTAQADNSAYRKFHNRPLISFGTVRT